MIELSSYTYPSDIEHKRLIDFAHLVLSSILTKSAAKKAIKQGAILVDGEIVESGRYINPGQRIQHIELEKSPNRVFELTFDVIYEDEYLAVINKPAGYSVSGNYFRTIENAIPFNFYKSKVDDALHLAKPVHRLDNQTSGLLVIAKTNQTRLNIGKQFEAKQVKKKISSHCYW